MGNVPHYPWYPDDYLSSPWVMTATLAEEAVYRRLLDYQWKSPGCQLPDDLRYLQRLCKSGVKIKTLESILTVNFTKVRLNSDVYVWRNERLYYEFHRTLQRSEKARESVKYRKSRPIKETNDSRTIEHNDKSNPIELQSNANLPEVEVEVEVKPKTLETTTLSGKPDSAQKIDIPYEDIINDLNSKAGTSFKHKSKKTRDLIINRYSEGFTINDFFIVHNNQVKRWINDSQMKKFIRPETLYGTKFEGYLNHNPEDENGLQVNSGRGSGQFKSSTEQRAELQRKKYGLSIAGICKRSDLQPGDVHREDIDGGGNGSMEAEAHEVPEGEASDAV